MVVMAVITAVFTLGITFYVRFFIALCKDSHPTWIGYFVRIEPGEGGEAGVEPGPEPEPGFREATPVDLQCV